MLATDIQRPRGRIPKHTDRHQAVRCGMAGRRVGALLCRCENGIERFRVVRRQLGENFAVQRDVCLLQRIYESTISDTLGPASSVDALRPKGPVIGLLVFAVREAVREAMPHGILGVPEFLAAPTAVTGGGFDDAFAATLTGGGVGSSRHCKLSLTL